MKYQEPGTIEIWVTQLAGNLFDGIYRNYVERFVLRGNERVLEVGPSAGNNTRHLARRLLSGGGKVTCVEISETWMRVLQTHLKDYPNVQYITGDIATCPLPSAAYDAVLISFVLHEIPADKRAKVAVRLANVLVGGGVVYLREPLRFISQVELQQLMGQAGLRQISAQVVKIKTQGQVFEAVYCKDR